MQSEPFLINRKLTRPSAIISSPGSVVAIGIDHRIRLVVLVRTRPAVRHTVDIAARAVGLPKAEVEMTVQHNLPVDRRCTHRSRLAGDLVRLDDLGDHIEDHPEAAEDIGCIRPVGFRIDLEAEVGG